MMGYLVCAYPVAQEGSAQSASMATVSHFISCLFMSFVSVIR